MKVAIIIPARLASTRLPNKPLAMIDGKPMVIHVMQAAMAANIGEVIVATDSIEIAYFVDAFGGSVVGTGACATGTDRVQIAAQFTDAELIVNVQGDLPTIRPEDIRAVVHQPFLPVIATLAAPLQEGDALNPNVVKVAGNRLDETHIRCQAFSRGMLDNALHHVGVYAYRRGTLDWFVSAEQTPNERRESLEQLRAMDAGMDIDATLIERAPQSVDTFEDLQKVIAELEQ